MPELKNCPFCGCKMKVWKYEEDEGIDQFDYPENDGKCILYNFEFPGTDVEAWNRRV